jgi:hypothetical protein
VRIRNLAAGDKLIAEAREKVYAVGPEPAFDAVPCNDALGRAGKLHYFELANGFPFADDYAGRIGRNWVMARPNRSAARRCSDGAAGIAGVLPNIGGECAIPAPPDHPGWRRRRISAPRRKQIQQVGRESRRHLIEILERRGDGRCQSSRSERSKHARYTQRKRPARAAGRATKKAAMKVYELIR